MPRAPRTAVKKAVKGKAKQTSTRGLAVCSQFLTILPHLNPLLN